MLTETLMKRQATGARAQTGATLFDDYDPAAAAQLRPLKSRGQTRCATMRGAAAAASRPDARSAALRRRDSDDAERWDGLY